MHTIILHTDGDWGHLQLSISPSLSLSLCVDNSPSCASLHGQLPAHLFDPYVRLPSPAASVPGDASELRAGVLNHRLAAAAWAY